tara:strand:+ start:162 stop:1007 length:846 start_codon:yes stop_codon:yes gene_type:complete
MKCKIITLTPELAKELLELNTKNRDVNECSINHYCKLMKSNEWVENGLPIIINEDGVLIDGQHRLLSVIKTKHSYQCPIITDVSRNAMATIDTGKNRSLGDVLKLHKYDWSSRASSIIKMILAHDRGVQALAFTGGSYVSQDSKGATKVSNAQGLKYMEDNYDYIYSLLRSTSVMYEKMTIPYYSLTMLCFVRHLLSDGDTSNEVVNDFVLELCGVNKTANTAVDYVSNLALKSKVNKTPVSAKFMLGLIIKAYNLYIAGNPPVKYMRYDINNPLPTIDKL